MAEINLSQTEADLLIAMPKVKINNQVWDYPSFGGSISIPLTSTDKKENFTLDVSRSHISLDSQSLGLAGWHAVIQTSKGSFIGS